MTRKKKILDTFIVITVLSICFIACEFTLGTALVSGSSMNPTMNEGDFLIVSRVKSLERYDIVAVESDKLGKYLCKRIIGLAGDHIVINSDGLFINDELMNEDYIQGDDWFKQTGEVDLIVPDNEIFVMGDNRLYSTDSRVLGCFETSAVYGVSILDLTSTFGVTKKSLIIVTAILWTLFLGSYISGKKVRPKKED